VLSAAVLVIPVCLAESAAREADDNLRLSAAPAPQPGSPPPLPVGHAERVARASAAGTAYESAFRTAPRNPDYVDRAADAWYVATDASRVRRAADAAVAASPGNPGYRRHRAELLLALPTPDVAAAAADYAECVRLDPMNLPPRVRLGRLYEQLGRPDDAAAAYRAAVDLDARLPDAEQDRLPATTAIEAWAWLADRYEAQGKHEDAATAYAGILAVDARTRKADPAWKPPAAVERARAAAAR
jgi:tetratricopeptide (TPR) repeat protein